MKKKPFPEFKKHLTRFLILAELFFAMIFTLNLAMIFGDLGVEMQLGFITKLSMYLFTFIAVAMWVMASYYRKNLAQHDEIKEA